MIKVTPQEIEIISQYVGDRSGILLDQSKGYLIETRLRNLIKKLGCTSYSELYLKAKSDASGSLEKKIIEAIATNETSFFRDTYPFEILQRKILPALIDKRTNKGTTESSSSSRIPIRIWSAGCSTGQEAYSIAIVLKELIDDLNKFNINILGTDVSDASIARASYGEYNIFEVERGLSEGRLNKYFYLSGNNWKIKDEIRVLTTFKTHNLIEPLTGLGRFDIVFCRNVAIYFTPEARVELFNKIADILDPDGYLLIGASESLMDICPRFEPKRYFELVLYQLKDPWSNG